VASNQSGDSIYNNYVQAYNEKNSPCNFHNKKINLVVSEGENHLFNFFSSSKWQEEKNNFQTFNKIYFSGSKKTTGQMFVPSWVSHKAVNWLHSWLLDDLGSNSLIDNDFKDQRTRSTHSHTNYYFPFMCVFTKTISSLYLSTAFVQKFHYILRHLGS